MRMPLDFDVADTHVEPVEPDENDVDIDVDVDDDVDEGDDE